MADVKLRVIGEDQASDELNKIDNKLNQLGQTADGKGSNSVNRAFSALRSNLFAFTAAIAGAGIAAQQAYRFIKEGAQLDMTATQFENVATNAGYLSDVLLNDLRRATGGLVSDAELMSSGLQIIELGLADSQEGVVRLATAVSTLGLDMQQVIMTFANDSIMRLDALGLSVETVTNRAKELEAQGFSGDAFDQAVLEGLEARMRVLGDASETTAGQIQMLDVEWTNLMNTLKGGAAAMAGPVVASINDAIDVQREANQAIESGAVSKERMMYLNDAFRQGVIDETQLISLLVAAQEHHNSVTSRARDLSWMFEGGISNVNVALEQNRGAGYDAAEATDAYTGSIDNASDAQREQNSLLAESARQWSTINTNISATVDALRERLEFIAGGGGVLLDLEDAIKDAMDRENFTAAEQGLNALEEATILYQTELGNITTDEAVAELTEMGFPLDDAKIKVDAVQQGLWDLTSQNYEVIINVTQRGVPFREDVNYNRPGSPTGDYTETDLGPKIGFASGTGGWMRVPGAPGQPYHATLHGGEMFNVVPQGQSSSGGGVVNEFYGDFIVMDGSDFEATVARMASNAQRNAMSSAAGASYIG